VSHTPSAAALEKNQVIQLKLLSFSVNYCYALCFCLFKQFYYSTHFIDIIIQSTMVNEFMAVLHDKDCCVGYYY